MSVESEIKKLLWAAADEVYLSRLLKLCTPEQMDMYRRMYPSNPTPSQRTRATEQVEATLLGMNRDVQQLRNIKKEFEARETEYEAALLALGEQVSGLRGELRDARYQIRLLSTPINTGNAKIQGRLDKLDALEAAGVDNWEGYDFAMAALHGDNE